jgi:plastocyanin
MRTPFAVTALVLAALSAGAPALGSGTRTVKVSDYKFTKKVLHVRRGTTVTWRWVGEDPHNVRGRGFHSRTQAKGTFRHRFSRPGTYRYVCTLHAKSFGMRGTIVVR